MKRNRLLLVAAAPSAPLARGAPRNCVDSVVVFTDWRTVLRLLAVVKLPWFTKTALLTNAYLFTLILITLALWTANPHGPHQWRA